VGKTTKLKRRWSVSLSIGAKAAYSPSSSDFIEKLVLLKIPSPVSLAIVIGALLGAMAEFFGGWLDDSIMRSMDVLQAFPGLLLAIAIVADLGPGLINALLAIAIIEIPIFARVVRASVLSVKELEYIDASRALGASELRILFTRIMPNSLTPLIVQGTLGIASAILSAAALSFLGLVQNFLLQNGD
jgi:peptide/nickel transport system permease protein